MPKAIHYIFIACGLLTACTDNGLLFRSFGDYGAEEDTATYKIGQPYQIKDVWYTPKEDYTYRETGVAGWYQEEQGKLTSNGEKYDEEAMTGMHKTLPLPSVVRVTNLENGNVAIVRINERGPYVNNRLIDVSQKAAEMLEFNMVGTTMVKVEILPEESKILKKQLFKNADGFFSEEESVLSANVQVTQLSDIPQPLYQPDEETQVLYQGSDVKTVENSQTKNDNNLSGGIVSVTQPLLDTTAAVLASSEPIGDRGVTIQYPPSEVVTEKHRLIAPISGYYVQAGAFANPENALKLKESLKQFGPVQIYETKVNSAPLSRVRMGPLETRESAEELLKKLQSGGFKQTQIIYEP